VYKLRLRRPREFGRPGILDGSKPPEESAGRLPPAAIAKEIYGAVLGSFGAHGSTMWRGLNSLQPCLLKAPSRAHH